MEGNTWCICYSSQNVETFSLWVNWGRSLQRCLLVAFCTLLILSATTNKGFASVCDANARQSGEKERFGVKRLKTEARGRER